MDFEKLARKAQQIVDERGGIESVKEDAQELEGIFQGDGTLSEKAKLAAAAIKEPGAPGSHPQPQDTAPPTDEQQ